MADEGQDQVATTMTSPQPASKDQSQVAPTLTPTVDKHNGTSYPPQTPDSNQQTISSPGFPSELGLSIETGLETVYIEQRNGTFKPTSTMDLMLSGRQDRYADASSRRWWISSALDMAIALQKVWFCLSNFCFGLLAGVAALHLIIIFWTLPISWTDAETNARTVELYSNTAFILPIVFYLCLVICLVSLMDRYDTSQLENDNLKDRVSYKILWLIMVLYLLIFLLHALSAKYDDLFVLYRHNNPTITYQSQSMVAQLKIWRWLDASKCSLCIIGWALVSLIPSKDFLLHHLKYLKTYDLETPLTSH